MSGVGGGATSPHRERIEDQRFLFGALKWYWTSPESGATVVQISGRKKDDLVLLCWTHPMPPTTMSGAGGGATSPPRERIEAISFVPSRSASRLI